MCIVTATAGIHMDAFIAKNYGDDFSLGWGEIGEASSVQCTCCRVCLTIS